MAPCYGEDIWGNSLSGGGEASLSLVDFVYISGIERAICRLSCWGAYVNYFNGFSTLILCTLCLTKCCSELLLISAVPTNQLLQLAVVRARVSRHWLQQEPHTTMDQRERDVSIAVVSVLKEIFELRK
ncbi:hypothetical protein P8452_59619 [Trifolium repens]|nr:hypothetical protein P8452_59619 [Trifolium repens]